MYNIYNSHQNCMIVGCGVVYAVVYGGGVMIVGCGQWQGRMQGGGGGGAYGG